MGFVALGLALRYDAPGRESWFTLLAFWFFAVGWAAAKADTIRQRIALSAVLLIGTWGYFGNGGRETLVAAGLLLLIWLPAVRCPAPVALGAGILAQGSLYTYLTHFQIYPLFGHPLPGVLVSLLVGSGVGLAVSGLRRYLGVAELRSRRNASAPWPERFGNRAA
jgi:hypothetical protein